MIKYVSGSDTNLKVYELPDDVRVMTSEDQAILTQLELERQEREKTYKLRAEKLEKQLVIQSQIGTLKQWFNREYRYFNEKLTRLQALSISEICVDNVRGKQYTTLLELYTEAEVVRQEINDLEKCLAE